MINSYVDIWLLEYLPVYFYLYYILRLAWNVQFTGQIYLMYGVITVLRGFVEKMIFSPNLFNYQKEKNESIKNSHIYSIGCLHLGLSFPKIWGNL